MRAVLIAGLALLFAYACVPPSGGGGGSSPQGPRTQNPRPRPGPDDQPPTPKREAKPAGAACSTAAECESGICEGEGCGDSAGTCASASRACTRDLRQYCGCDGQTFQASGSCPGQRFSKPGPC